MREWYPPLTGTEPPRDSRPSFCPPVRKPSTFQQYRLPEFSNVKSRTDSGLSLNLSVILMTEGKSSLDTLDCTAVISPAILMIHSELRSYFMINIPGLGFKRPASISGAPVREAPTAAGNKQKRSDPLPPTQSRWNYKYLLRNSQDSKLTKIFTCSTNWCIKNNHESPQFCITVHCQHLKCDVNSMFKVNWGYGPYKAVEIL